MNTIDELIAFLIELRKIEENLPLMQEYDATSWLGISPKVQMETNPDDILGAKIKVLHF